MYQIALCDDEPTELHTMERMLRSYPGHPIKGTLAVRQFESADALLFAIEQESYVRILSFWISICRRCRGLKRQRSWTG